MSKRGERNKEKTLKHSCHIAYHIVCLRVSLKECLRFIIWVRKKYMKMVLEACAKESGETGQELASAHCLCPIRNDP